MAKNSEGKVPARSRKAKQPAVAPMVARETETKAATKAKAKAAPAPAITPEERAHLIAEAAYYRAEARGFAPGNEVGDWLAAEHDVDVRISTGASA